MVKYLFDGFIILVGVEYMNVLIRLFEKFVYDIFFGRVSFEFKGISTFEVWSVKFVESVYKFLMFSVYL